MTAKQDLSFVWFILFVCGTTLAGLAVIHIIWLHPDAIGPLALMIGMTPFVLLFEHSLDIPAVWFPIGAICSGISWWKLRGNPQRPIAAKLVFISGGGLMGLSVLTFVAASVHYNVGMAGPVPAGWYSWIRPAAKFGEVGLLLFAVAFVAMRPSSEPDATLNVNRF